MESDGVRWSLIRVLTNFILSYLMLCYLIYVLTTIVFKDGRKEYYTPYINISPRRTDLALCLIIKRGCVTVGQCGPRVAKSGTMVQPQPIGCSLPTTTTPPHPTSFAATAVVEHHHHRPLLGAEPGECHPPSPS